MDRSSNIQLKCRICSSPHTTSDFAQLDGWKARMFTEVVGVGLTTDGIESESGICQQCLNKLEMSYNFKAKARRAAERQHLKIQRRLTAMRQMANEPAQVPGEPETTASDQKSMATSDQSDDEDEDIVNHPSEGKFRCPKCGYRFMSKAGLEHHERSKMIYKCAVCKVEFSCQLLRDRHQSKFHGNVFKCSQCDYQTDAHDRFMQHKRSHYKSFACSTCQKKFSVKQSLQRHQIQNLHGTYATTPEEGFDCLKCDVAFSSLNYLKMHQKRFHAEIESRGEVRDKIYKNRAPLRQHSELHDKVDCPICKKKIEKRFESAHLRSHSALLLERRRRRRRRYPARFECDICGKAFAMKSNLGYHMPKHSKEGNFGCIKCGYRFKSKQQLQLHERSTTTYKCAVCDVEFPCKLLRDRHQRESHGSFFKCNKCSYQTELKHSMMKHEETHDKPFTCESCQKKFATYQSKKRHQIRQHGTYAANPEGTFDCDECGKTLSSLNYLMTHQRAIHLDVKEIKCEVCGKTYKHRSALYRHRRIHKRVKLSISPNMIAEPSMAARFRSRSHPVENLFRCDFCDQPTVTKGHMERHMSRMHSNDPYESDSN